MTEDQKATLTRLAMILEAGQAENGIDLGRQDEYAEALRALLSASIADTAGASDSKPYSPDTRDAERYRALRDYPAARKALDRGEWWEDINAHVDKAIAAAKAKESGNDI